MLKKLACFTGWLLVLCFSVLFSFTLGLWQNWSTTSILVFCLSMLLITVLLWCAGHGLVLIIKGKKGRRLFEKYRLSRREFVLKAHWKTGASIIKGARRQRETVPLYLILGDRCGKSTLLASAGLPTFYNSADDTEIRLTRTLRWWFFRQLCVLDVSSNFLSGSPAIAQAWKRLVQWCTSMPAPAGVIIAIPVTSLLNQDLSALHSLIRQQRALLEPLVRRFGEQLPLHILITQCDRFPGFSLWAQQLSSEQRLQPLGYTWSQPPHIDGQDEQILQPLFSALRQGMSHIRLSMGRSDDLTATEYATLLDFPEAFSRLEPSLCYTVASLCEPNAYFRHTTLSSIWFCATEPLEENRSRRTGLFIHHLLAHHLKDLGLRRGNQHWFQRSHARKICSVAIAFIAVWITASAWLSFDYLNAKAPQQSPDSLAAFLAKDEARHSLSPRYLPFLPLLEQRREKAETRLVQSPSSKRQPEAALDAYQWQVLRAAPEEQRDLILSLANAVITWQQMRAGATLDELQKNASVKEALLQRDYPQTLSPLTVMAIERHFMRSPDGEKWLHTAQRLLESLVNHDPALQWLVAPGAMPSPLQAAAWWPSLSDSIALSSLWTLEGEKTYFGWINTLEKAFAHPLPILTQEKMRWPARRQDAWQRYLIEVSAHLSPTTPSKVSHPHLIAMGQNKSAAMQFMHRTLNELHGITAAQAQPWLQTLRQLQQLSADANTSAMVRRTRQIDRQVRQSFIAWLQGRKDNNIPGGSAPADRAWLHWQDVRNKAVKEAVSQGIPDAHLTRALFAKNDNGDGNPLTDLLPALTALQEHLTPQNTDAGINAVWLFYQNDARRLAANAIHQSACWLNEQWKRSVIWPLGKNNETRDYEQQQALSQQLVGDFLRGPASPFLAKAKNGLGAVSFTGIQAPLTEEFIHLVRHNFSAEKLLEVQDRQSTRDGDQMAALVAKVATLEGEQTTLSKKIWKLSVASMPASVPGGAQLVPTGTQLTLSCQKGEQKFLNMNFADKHDFSWQPGQCTDVTVSVIFPGFTVHHRLYGEDAWPAFIRRFNSGEALFQSDEFGDDEDLLKQTGIKHLLVRFALSDTNQLETAWQSWDALAQNIDSLNTQIADLAFRSETQLSNPISALPGDIAQCN
ncbi:hypothetical protein F3J27_14875 [Enterobacter sp. Ap-916]|uniref:type VI secretion system protein n=1 Tax=unclassified Enterobacter TaxID=2608935 RepID=UPI0014208C83|nr:MULTISPECIES: type VI secretion system protein [unclassified Enterobacter]NIF59511.1 hypothetical protein [Enterobacter sp. Ap-867]NIG30763.1 hypothetical protein [Enterobacter sp. Ap-916]